MTPEPGRTSAPLESEEFGDASSPSSTVTRLLQAHREPFQSPPGLPLRQFLRRNLLLIVSSLAFAGVTLLVVLQIDTAYYEDQKRELLTRIFIEERLRQDPLLEELSTVAGVYVSSYIDRERIESDAVRENRRLIEQRFENVGQRLLDAYPFVVRVELLSKNRTPIIGTGTRQSRAITGDFSNSLLPRPFVQEWTQIKGNNGTLLVIAITAPKGNPQIEALTRRWQIYTLLIVTGIALTYILFLSRLLMPMRTLIRALDKGPAVGSPIIPRPRTLIEKYYNNLARDATLSVFSTALREFLARHRLLERQPLLELAPQLLGELFPVEHAALVVFRHDEESGTFVPAARYDANGTAPDCTAFIEHIATKLNASPGSSTLSTYDAALFDDPPEGQAGWWAEAVGASEHHLSILVLRLPGARSAQFPWWKDLGSRAAREVRYALQAVAEQRRLILTEKSKANISLSRNIGHDLTNIIATSKLELMSLKTLLELPREELDNPRKQAIFRESLESLLNNTRFLQETVNLYRSFTYLSRPKFEETDLNELVRDVAALFKLSLSRAISIEIVLEEDMETAEIEPRLLRLALFNLLSNAADAIKRETSAERPAGTVTIRTRTNPDSGLPEIAVEDTGGGIRADDGRLLEPHEIDEIFQLGYSTKEKGASEGLGLNWVQQIVREFHGGEVAARNRPEGGASFTIILPSHRFTPRHPAPDLLHSPNQNIPTGDSR
ncbi:MAG: hypothetical protein PWP23_1617 [Candidatus Sumerlaeota bacterium]|nr:hypothetical protein [Candidatus Sumerlaeota bacterium]